jgi:very-short-patch-repair endonuclease
MYSIIYGEEIPKISFTQSPKGGHSFVIENERVIEIDNDIGTLTWKDFYVNARGNREYKWKLQNVKLGAKEHFASFVQGLLELCGSPYEKKFLKAYTDLCGSEYKDDPWCEPALIPQVWVNWIHYDRNDKGRAKRAQREPFRVDFVMKDAEISENYVIVEIDGISHFGEYRISPLGKPVPHQSMDLFTQHTQRDRWLRKNGWQVFRITTQEVDECESIAALLHDVLGKWFDDDIPF